MEKAALDRLESLISTVYTKLPETDIPTILLPTATKVESLESKMAAPARFRAKFTTKLLGEFSKYCNDNAGPDSAIFVDPDQMSALAILDMGADNFPQWGEHRAELVMTMTPAYKALLSIDGLGLNQRHLIDFLTDWQPYITLEAANGDEMPFSVGIQRLRKIKIGQTTERTRTEGDMSRARSAMEQIEATSGADELPARFVFDCQPYHQIAEKQFICRLQVLTDEKVNILYRIQAKEQETEDIATEFAEKLKTIISPDVRLHIGTVNYQ